MPSHCRCALGPSPWRCTIAGDDVDLSRRAGRSWDSPIRLPPTECVVGRHQEATQRQCVHPSVGARAGEGARGGAALFRLGLGHLAHRLVVVSLARCGAGDGKEKERMVLGFWRRAWGQFCLPKFHGQSSDQDEQSSLNGLWSQPRWKKSFHSPGPGRGSGVRGRALGVSGPWAQFSLWAAFVVWTVRKLIFLYVLSIVLICKENSS
jgi:hypothetical protein